jgi:Pyruvate-formate lyase-activating enzyme
MNGKIHSIESMGLVDGPGIRTVIFFQGCKLRCAYCHNPDTWATFGGKEIDSSELIKKVLRYKPYFTRSGGGVTFSGGDPLMQPVIFDRDVEAM